MNKSLKSMLLGSASLFVATSAHAQDAGSASGVPSLAIETVVVSGSRIAKAGIDQPTPVTVASLADVQSAQEPDLNQYLNNELPALSGGAVSDRGTFGFSGGQYGTNTIGLRGLGVNRTLTLVDGHRMTESSNTGAIDVDEIPQGLIQRTEIVTGGASAAWGSDAVAGVVNFVLDHNFEGLKVDVTGGIDQYVQHGDYKADVTWGTSLLGGKLHLEAAVEYGAELGQVVSGEAWWYKGTKLLTNPVTGGVNPTAAEPQYIQENFVGSSQVSAGGIVTVGPLAGLSFGPTGTALKNTENPGQGSPNATPGMVSLGTVSGPLAYGGQAQDIAPQIQDLGNPNRRATAYGRASYQITDYLSVYGEYWYGNEVGENVSAAYYQAGSSSGNGGAAIVTINNPWLDPGIKAQMVTDGITQFGLGKAEWDALLPKGVSQHTLQQGVFGFDGNFGDTWTWNVNYVHGAMDYDANGYDVQNTARLVQATNAVRSPTTGGIVCASTLTNPNDGCVPFDVMGINVNTPAAVAYVDGYTNPATGQTIPGPWQKNMFVQNFVSFQVNGKPFSLWAGPVSVAFGGEYRDEAIHETTDPLGPLLGWAMLNGTPYSASNEVKEGFAEVDAPLLSDAFLTKALELDMAGRYTDYKYSGGVETWKLGLLDQITDDIRLRGAWSYDIRAPNIAELAAPGSSANQSVQDTVNHSTQANSEFTISASNPDLKPEVSRTLSFGTIVTPTGVPGLSASVDYYKIDISGAIAAPTAQLTVNYCAAGQQIFCSRITRNSAGTITSVLDLPTNINSISMDGLDFGADYAMPLFSGDLAFHGLASVVNKLSTIQFGTLVQGAGSVGPNGGTAEIPSFKATLAVSYTEELYSLTVSSRLIGPEHNDQNWNATILAPQYNNVPFIGYLDLRASYRPFKETDAQFYFSIDNALNQAPPPVATTPGGVTPWYTNGVAIAYYDPLGRQFNFGVTLKY